MNKRKMLFVFILCSFLGTTLIAGYQLQNIGFTAAGVLGKLKVLGLGALVGLIICPFMWLGFTLVQKAENRVDRNQDKKWNDKWIFLACFIGIWICFLPVWLAYYPAIMSYDFHRQSMEAARGLSSFNNHHPLAHTWLIYVFRNLGGAIGSYRTGFALFSQMQQVVTAAVLAYACVMIYRLSERKWAIVAAALFFGCFPLISVFVMCTTKDVLFGAFFLLFLLLLLKKLYFATEGRGRLGNEIGLVLAGVGMILFRNNALYAMPLLLVFVFILAEKRKRVNMLVLLVLIMLLGKGALMGLQYGLAAHKGSEIEKYSVIYQSMARVGFRQGQNLTEEQAMLIDRYVTRECWGDYNPPLADTIKEPVQRINWNKQKSWESMPQVLKAWLQVGMWYPNEYVDAFLDLTRGYWYLGDRSHAEMLGVGKENRMGLLYTYNSVSEEALPQDLHQSRFPWLEDKLENIVSANSYRRVPVVVYFFTPAFWCLLLIIGFTYAWYAKNKKKMLVLIYPLAYFATMLLGPTAIIRYVYPFILMAPVMLAMLCTSKTE